jgi:hypothetical protein
MGACISLFWGVVGLNWTISVADQIVLSGLMAIVRQPAFLVFNFIINLTAILAQLWLGIGMTIGLLKVARHEPVSFNVVFAGGRSLFTVILGGTIVVAIVLGPVLAFGVGLGALFVHMRRMGTVVALLMFVLGSGMAAVWFLYMGARLILYYYFAIDRNLGIFDSIRSCWQSTENRAATIILAYLLQPCLSLAGLLACCVGLFWALPLASLINVVTYLALTGPAPSASKPRPKLRDDDHFYPAEL